VYPRIQQHLTDLAIRNPGVQGRFKIAAAVVYKKTVIATGINQYKTHPIMANTCYKEEQVFLHAEADAIRNSLRLISPEQLTKCEMYIVRVKRPDIHSTDWVQALAKPCPGCRKLLANFGLKAVHWTEDPILDNKPVDVFA
jgi:cytidine deaminase